MPIVVFGQKFPFSLQKASLTFQWILPHWSFWTSVWGCHPTAKVPQGSPHHAPAFRPGAHAHLHQSLPGCSELTGGTGMYLHTPTAPQPGSGAAQTSRAAALLLCWAPRSSCIFLSLWSVLAGQALRRLRKNCGASSCPHRCLLSDRSATFALSNHPLKLRMGIFTLPISSTNREDGGSCLCFPCAT